MSEPPVQSADAQIRNLLARLAHLGDGGPLEDYLDLFTEDAVWEMPGNPAVNAPADRRTGRADIAEGIRARRGAGRQGPGSATRHMVSTIDVTVESEDNAHSVACWLFLMDTTGAPRLASAGCYHDELRRVDGQWRLAHRRITIG